LYQQLAEIKPRKHPCEVLLFDVNETLLDSDSWRIVPTRSRIQGLVGLDPATGDDRLPGRALQAELQLAR
jgi:hypothetical protein